jgi:hypothetical protein
VFVSATFRVFHHPWTGLARPGLRFPSSTLGVPKTLLRWPSIWKWNDFSVCFSPFSDVDPVGARDEKSGRSSCCWTLLLPSSPVKVGMDATFFLSRSTNPAAITATTTAHKTSRVVLVLLLLSGWYNWTDARPRQRQQKKLRRREKKFFVLSHYWI